MYSPLDSGPTIYPENTVGHGREFLYLDGIYAAWHDVQSKDRQSDRRLTCQNSLMNAVRRHSDDRLGIGCLCTRYFRHAHSRCVIDNVICLIWLVACQSLIGTELDQ